MANATIRNYRPSDADEFNRIAVAAFSQFESSYEDWPAMRAIVAKASGLSDAGEVIVAEADGRLAGAVAYVGPGVAKASFFDPAWPVIRMLVVDPECRGKGIGRALTDECLVRARRDRADVIALHTSPIMSVALPMYLRMGFAKVHDAPPLFGVPYAVYTKAL
jgi:ribosomal protein S18 acetylase RimI-like enzyme